MFAPSQVGWEAAGEAGAGRKKGRFRVGGEGGWAREGRGEGGGTWSKARRIRVLEGWEVVRVVGVGLV